MPTGAGIFHNYPNLSSLPVNLERTLHLARRIRLARNHAKRIAVEARLGRAEHHAVKDIERPVWKSSRSRSDILKKVFATLTFSFKDGNART